MEQTKIQIRNVKFRVDLSKDFYGPEFWKSYESETWEPDTLSWIFRTVRKGTTFLDIGAANGSLSLLASSLGALVKAYEPNPIVFDVLERNVKCNPRLRKRIKLHQAAIGTNYEKVTFTPNSSKFLTRMTILDKTNHDLTEVVSFTEIISQIQSEHILMKVDIEGAEFPLFSNRDVLQNLKSKSCKVFLSLHPGFQHNYRDLGLLNKIIGKFLFMRNSFDCIRLYQLMSQYCRIYRTSNQEIKNKRTFSMLVMGGCHDYILDFSS